MDNALTLYNQYLAGYTPVHIIYIYMFSTIGYTCTINPIKFELVARFTQAVEPSISVDTQLLTIVCSQ